MQTIQNGAADLADRGQWNEAHLRGSCKLEDWGIPGPVVAAWKLPNGRMYDWQAECLSRPRVAAGGNLVFTAPTSSGKSLVAEVSWARMMAPDFFSRTLLLTLTIYSTDAQVLHACASSQFCVARILVPVQLDAGYEMF